MYIFKARIHNRCVGGNFYDDYYSFYQEYLKPAFGIGFYLFGQVENYKWILCC